jgi:BirA family biotin operon repressor/biotin-[acetyl-CoA-carboxylase] ligase
MKNKILNVLKQDGNAYISGERLSELLGVSRTAIWKHIKSLRAEGYQIDSATNKGYRLISESEGLSEISLNEIIQSFEFLDFSSYHETIDSTNLEAKRRALESENAQGIIIASEQLSGKGRLGRQWASENQAGLWMSLLIRPNVPPESAACITLVAASSMCEAIEKTTDLKVGIKWPNDLVIKGKKCCGILTEMSAELNHLHYIVLGIGVNIGQLNFDEMLKEKATSLEMEGAKISAKNLLIAFLDAFSNDYRKFLELDMAPIIDYHKSHSVTLNKEIVVASSTGSKIAQAVDLAEDGSLIIKNQNGQLENVLSGEVSVRGINGYV